MLRSSRLVLSLLLVLAFAVGGVLEVAAKHHKPRPPTGPQQQLELSPSQQAIAQCLPGSDVDVTVTLTTDAVGFDSFTVRVTKLAPNIAYTVFLLEQAADPFGAAEYIGDVSTDAQGNGQNTFQLIVQEAFSSTLVGTTRVRKELNRVGVWFADPADDDFCTGAKGIDGVTPFDGDNEAGIQVFNSANAAPLPPP
jgi:hypothetical protein